MGAWGHGPADSDSAGEFFFFALKDVPKRIRKGLRSNYDMEIRAAAFLLEQVGYANVYPDADELVGDLKTAIDRLGLLLADRDSLADWDDRKGIVKEIRRQKSILEKRLTVLAAPRSRILMDQIMKRLK